LPCGLRRAGANGHRTQCDGKRDLEHQHPPFEFFIFVFLVA
jgi:hypothetical protein